MTLYEKAKINISKFLYVTVLELVTINFILIVNFWKIND